MQGKRTPVRCVETGLVYESITAAAKACYGDTAYIWKALNGQKETAYGYHWEYV